MSFWPLPASTVLNSLETTYHTLQRALQAVPVILEPLPLEPLLLPLETNTPRPPTMRL